MIAKLHSWWEETHGSNLELLRHFLARFFDSEMVTSPGEWHKVAAGVFTILLSASILPAQIYMRRYNFVHFFSTREVYRQWIRDDILSLVGVAVAVTVLFTVLLWHSLFPTARDYLALASLPVSARQIFAAKFSALLLVFGAFLFAVAVPPALMFHAVSSGRWQENPSSLAYLAANAAAIGGACVFVFFSLLALQGMLLNVLPARVFDRAAVVIQAALFIGTLGGLPLLGKQPSDALWWPPVWFLRLWESMVAGPRDGAQFAIAAIFAPPLLAAGSYLLSYHRYRRLLLEAPRERSSRLASPGSWLLERWIGDPREQAAFAFVWKTLFRSRSHRLILMSYAGLALGWISKGLVDAPRPSLRDQGMYGLTLVLVPLALSVVVTAGLRYTFSLPVALRSNWMFQTNDEEGGRAWLAAVERFVLWCGVAPVLLAALPAEVALLGGLRALAVTALVLLAALIWFEALFHGWRKLAFTCSYLPGKKPVLFVLARYCVAISLLAPAAQLILRSSGIPAAFAALGALMTLVWWKLRRERMAFWADCSLCYEERPDPAVVTLDLDTPRWLVHHREMPGSAAAVYARTPAARDRRSTMLS